MKWTISMDERLGLFDRTSLGFKALLSGENLARIGKPDFGERFPTPGSAKIPEIVKGSIVAGTV